jgi:hypothetical protein
VEKSPFAMEEDNRPTLLVFLDGMYAKWHRDDGCFEIPLGNGESYIATEQDIQQFKQDADKEIKQNIKEKKIPDEHQFKVADICLNELNKFLTKRSRGFGRLRYYSQLKPTTPAQPKPSDAIAKSEP